MGNRRCYLASSSFGQHPSNGLFNTKSSGAFVQLFNARSEVEQHIVMSMKNEEDFLGRNMSVGVEVYSNSHFQAGITSMI
ncbi:MAG: hypothetical protein IKD78_11655 [Bacteroidales bacterium]|nr:hypothetical protein [Bacteroidales bacterium]